MSRQLKMAQIKTVRSLHEAGHPNRAISRLTGIYREMVGKYVSQPVAKPAKPDRRDQAE